MPNQKYAIFLILLSSFFFALMALAVKFVENYPVSQILFFRGIVAIIIIGIYNKFKGIPFIPQNIKFNFLRSVLGTLGVVTYYYSIAHIPLANAVILNKLSPFFVIIFSSIFLHEKIKKFQIVAIFIALIGVILVVKPGGDLSFYGTLAGFITAIIAGATFVMIIKRYPTPPLEDFLILVSVGIFAMIAQTLLTYAYKYASASRISIYSFGNIIFSFIFTIIFFNKIPDIASVLGAMIIISAAYLNFYKSKDLID